MIDLHSIDIVKNNVIIDLQKSTVEAVKGTINPFRALLDFIFPKGWREDHVIPPNKK